MIDHRVIEARLRKAARDQCKQLTGDYIRERRRVAGLTQQALGERLGATKIFVSQIEQGLCGVPSARYGEFAQALGVPKRALAVELLRRAEPAIYACLFTRD